VPASFANAVVKAGNQTATQTVAKPPSTRAASRSIARADTKHSAASGKRERAQARTPTEPPAASTSQSACDAECRSAAPAGIAPRVPHIILNQATPRVDDSHEMWDAAGGVIFQVATTVFGPAKLLGLGAKAAGAAPKLLNTARGNLLQGARNPRLRNLIEQMYRKTAAVGSGSTADAIRYELRTGELLSRSGHTIKGQEMRQALLNVIKGGGLDAGDAQIARGLLSHLQSALSGL